MFQFMTALSSTRKRTSHFISLRDGEYQKINLKMHPLTHHGLQIKSRAIDPTDMPFQSIGSISHLSEYGQPETFLNQVSKVLRPGTGRAYASHASRPPDQEQSH
jgi:hypothetical protein